MSVEKWCEERERLIREAARTEASGRYTDEAMRARSDLRIMSALDQPAVVELVRAAEQMLEVREKFIQNPFTLLKLDADAASRARAALAKLTGESDE